MLKRILVGLGGTAFAPVAIQRSIEIAKQHGAELTAVTVVDVERLSQVGPVPAGGGGAARRLAEHRVRVTRERIEQCIELFEKECTQAGVAHSVERETGDTFELLVARWRYQDLVVMGLRGLYDYGVVSEQQDSVLRLFSAGVRPIIATAEKYRPIKRALILYDGSLESAKAMKRFVNMQIWSGIGIDIVCLGKPDEDPSGLLDDAARYCKAYGVEAHTLHDPGDPRKRLLKVAEERSADIIVIGVKLRATLLRKALGDSLVHWIRNADRPLFLAH